MRATFAGLPVATWYHRTVGGRLRAATGRLHRAARAITAPVRSRAVPLALTTLVVGGLLVALDLLAGSANRAATAIDDAHRAAATRPPPTPRSGDDAGAARPPARPKVLFYVGAH